MPCYQMQLMSVEFKAKYVDFLKQALDELGYRYEVIAGDTVIKVEHRYNAIWIDLAKSEIEFNRTSAVVVNRIRREYSRQVLQEVAKKKRWVVKKKQNRYFQLQKY